MGVFEQFPYTNIHNLNLDWVLREISQMKERIEQLPNVVQETGDSETDVMSQKAVTDLDAQTRGMIPEVVSLSGSSTLAAASQKLVTDLYNDAIAAIPTVVQSTGSSTANVMSQKAVTDAIPEVVQASGQDTTKVMSQKAVTDLVAGQAGGVSSIEHYHQAGTVVTPDTTINDKYYAATGLIADEIDAHGKLFVAPAPGVYHIRAGLGDGTHRLFVATWPHSAPNTEGWLDAVFFDTEDETYEGNFVVPAGGVGCMTVNSYDGAGSTITYLADPGAWEWDGQPANSVNTASIQTGAVTSTKIGAKAVTTAKIDDEAVTATQIADGTITSGKFNAAARIPGVQVVTSAPDAANTDGLKFAVLSAEPGTYYSGWVYIITE